MTIKVYVFGSSYMDNADFNLLLSVYAYKISYKQSTEGSVERV